MPEANLIEVFEGIQGEGLFVGVHQLFVRFAGCNLRCKFCDTRSAWEIPVEYKWEVRELTKTNAPKWKIGKNPISVGQLIEIIKNTNAHYHSLSLTGGEPLLQADFILEFLRLLPHPYSLLPTYLETNGTLPEELKKIIDYIKIIAMDIKLPSSTGLGELWEEHKEFLSVAQGCEIFVKIVITSETTLKDVKEAISLIKETRPQTLLILQPDTSNPPSLEVLFNYERVASHSLNGVRIIPQVHRLMGWR